MTPRPWRVPMLPRSPNETGRTATPLELFFDLVFVVAVAFAANELHRGVVDGHVGEAVVSYGLVFFLIWWAWMNFAWFASAYDTDDGPYRLAILVGIGGALILAAGVPEAFTARDFVVVATGYAVMRAALVSLWLRAAYADPLHRVTAIRHAVGVGVLQIGWVVLLFLPEPLRLAGFVVLAMGELAVPIWAEHPLPTPFNREHIAERYGLFTIIVLGESLAAVAIAIQSVSSAPSMSLDIIGSAAGGLVVVFAMWWLYFERPRAELLTSLPRAFIWGYGHYLVWAAAAAVGAGIAVAIDQATGHGTIGSVAAGAAIAVPAAVYIMTGWALDDVPGEPRSEDKFAAPIASLLILMTPLSGQAIPLIGLIFAVLVATKLVAQQRSRQTLQAQNHQDG